MEQIYAYAYCRYSSHNQDDGWSIESQRSAIEKYAKNNDIQQIAEAKHNEIQKLARKNPGLSDEELAKQAKVNTSTARAHRPR